MIGLSELLRRESVVWSGVRGIYAPTPEQVEAAIACKILNGFLELDGTESVATSTTTRTVMTPIPASIPTPKSSDLMQWRYQENVFEIPFPFCYLDNGVCLIYLLI